MGEGAAPPREIAGFMAEEVWRKDRLHIEVLADRPALLVWRQEELAPRFWVLNLEGAQDLADGLERALAMLIHRAAHGAYTKEEDPDAAHPREIEQDDQ